MFTSKDRLDRRTGPFGIGRLSYLQSLVNEFQETESEESKLQVLANLANFAYDPVNYDYIRRLNVIDLFLDCLDESNEKLVEFALGGLCNLVNDKLNQDHILANDGVNLVVHCLSSSNEETVLSAITTLIFLATPASKKDLTQMPIVDAMQKFSLSSNKRLSNLASVYLRDVCSPTQVNQVLTNQNMWNRQIKSHSAQVSQISSSQAEG